jgi:HPt (histidine-containing phosphotransfer) domain-containing protein
MEGNKQAAKHLPAGCFSRAKETLLHFFLRVLAPAARPRTNRCNPSQRPQDDPPNRIHRQSFSSELFAELLLELPVHRQRLSGAAENGDMDTLRKAVHQLLGAVAYCDAPELEEALRELRLAIKAGRQGAIKVYHEQLINVIDSTLRSSGYRSHIGCGQP